MLRSVVGGLDGSAVLLLIRGQAVIVFAVRFDALGRFAFPGMSWLCWI